MPRLDSGYHELSENVRVHVLDAPQPGPTVLVQAGIHGDEVAGVHALEELLEAKNKALEARTAELERQLAASSAAVLGQQRAAFGPQSL